MLRREPFTAAVLNEVRAFHCGDQPWAADVADWINTDRVLEDLRDADLNCRVWIWRDDNGNVVGFGSLGDAVFRVPNPNKSPWLPVTIIPALAVHSAHQGKGYARRIVEELLDLAAEHAAERRYVVLLVHTDNVRAHELYRRAGFRDLGKSFIEKETGWPHQKMYYDLHERRAAG
ncbi:MAG: GNAT family N-acetyltransferase [Chloroflexi bacterium]|nr:GNAT family N-acetyltransferase [Chloroflexota bacterium]